MLRDFLTLESRLAPSPMDLGSGIARIRSQPLFDIVAFPGFTGRLNVAEGLDPATGRPEVFVGAGDGGGPRLAGFDEATCVRLSDRFVGDPASRGGVVPFPVGAAAFPDTAHPTAGDPSGFPVYLPFEADQPAEFQAAVVSDFAALLPSLLIFVTTTRPDLPQTGYATVVIGAPTDFAGDQAAGIAYVGALHSGIPALVAAGYSPALTAVFAAHEFGHLAGLGHSADSRSVMFASPGPDATFSADELSTIRTDLTGS